MGKGRSGEGRVGKGEWGRASGEGRVGQGQGQWGRKSGSISETVCIKLVFPIAILHFPFPTPALPHSLVYKTRFFIHLSISVKNKLIKHIFFVFPFPTRRDPYRRRAFSIFRCFLMFLKTKSVVGKDKNSQNGTLATTHSPLTILLKF